MNWFLNIFLKSSALLSAVEFWKLQWKMFQRSSLIGVQYMSHNCHEISNNVVCATSKASDQLAHMGSLIRAFAIYSRLHIL